MTLLEQGRIQELDASVTKSFPLLPESRHMKSKPGRRFCRYFCVWQLA